MKVLLINPPRDNEIIGNNPAIIDEERGFNPPLGLLYLAASLEERTAHEPVVIDCQVERLDVEGIRRRVREHAPDVVGITVMTMSLIDTLNTIAAVKSVTPEVPVVLGGPHVHLFPEETIGLPGVDYLVLGEGERTFARLTDALDIADESARAAALDAIPGIVFEQAGRVIRTGPPEAVEDLDDIPFPARHLVPYKKYSSLLSAGQTVTTIFTSRGCPFKCRFCDRPHLGKRFRARSAMNTVDELERCVEMGIREFLIYDDTFTVNKRRARDICDEIVARGLSINFDIRARVDTIDDDLLARLRAAGCSGIHYGVEAGTPAALAALNKGITIPQVREVFAMTRRHGLPILAYFMIGNPGETRADILETFRVTRMLNPDFIHLTILTPFPGTRIYADALEKGIIESDVWRQFARNPTADFVPPHYGEHLTKAELQALLVRGYHRFYLRPRYIARRLSKLRSMDELKKKARAGVKVFLMKAAGSQ